jgi:hypothetical protein
LNEKKLLLPLVLTLVIGILLAACGGNAKDQNQTILPTPTPTIADTPTPTWDPNGDHIIQYSSMHPSGSPGLGRHTDTYPEITVTGACNFSKPVLQQFPILATPITIPDGKVMVVEDNTTYRDVVSHNTTGYSTNYNAHAGSYEPQFSNEAYIIVDAKDVGVTVAGLVTKDLDDHCQAPSGGYPDYYDSSLLDIQKDYPFPNTFKVSE